MSGGGGGNEVEDEVKWGGWSLDLTCPMKKMHLFRFDFVVAIVQPGTCLFCCRCSSSRNTPFHICPCISASELPQANISASLCHLSSKIDAPLSSPYARFIAWTRSQRTKIQCLSTAFSFKLSVCKQSTFKVLSQNNGIEEYSYYFLMRCLASM
jgi:hypothetical protein